MYTVKERKYISMKDSKYPIVSRGEIYYADLSPVVGSEQGGIRPVIVLQNDIGNKYSPTTIVSPITSRISKKFLPTHILLNECEGLKNSVVLLEQIRTIDKSRLKQKISQLPPEKVEALNNAIKISLGLA